MDAHHDTHLQDSSRRLTEVLRTYWQAKRGDRLWPSESDIDPDDLADVWDNCFLVHLRDQHFYTEYRYTYLGKSLIEAYGDDLMGQDVYHRLVEAPKGDLAEHFVDVIRTQSPVERFGEFINRHGMIIRYRACLLPLGNVGIDYLFGGMNWRAF